MSNIGRLVLGSACLGLSDYPPGRRTPRPTYAESGAIIRAALAAGITRFDTGLAYGDAEAIVLKWTRGCGVTVTSKCAPELIDIYTDEFAPFGGPVLLHNPTVAQLQNPSMTSLAEGASVYTPAEAFAAIDAGLKHLQIPYHALDQSHDRAGIFEAARKAGVTVMARQPWARGLLVKSLQGRTVPVGPWRRFVEWLKRLVGIRPRMPAIERYQVVCQHYGIGYVEAGLRFSLGLPEDALVVFGVSSLAQLEQAIAIASTDPPASWPACYAELLSTFADSALTLGSVCTTGR
jgi:aryl-alcohol dehydrogenase-like predicted oxidoreductase